MRPHGAERSRAADAAGGHDSARGSSATICARIDDELIALEALKLPKFLRIDVFVWPFLFLAGGVIAGLGLGTASAGRRPRSSGVVAGVAAGIGAYIGLSNDGAPRRGRAMPCRCARPSPRPTQLVEQNKDWVKNEFESKIRELEKNRETKVRDAEETMARRVAEFQERHQKQTEEADTDLPGQARGDPPAPATRGSRKPRTTIRPGSPRSRKNTRKIGASSTSRIGRPRRPPSSNTSRPGTS